MCDHDLYSRKIMIMMISYQAYSVLLEISDIERRLNELPLEERFDRFLPQFFAVFDFIILKI